MKSLPVQACGPIVFFFFFFWNVLNYEFYFLTDTEFSFFLLLLLFFFCLFFRATLVTYEVPRLGVKLELQLPAYATATTTWDPSLSAAYTTAHSNAGSPTHWARPGIELASSWIRVGFFSTEPWWELQFFSIVSPLSSPLISAQIFSYSFFLSLWV